MNASKNTRIETIEQLVGLVTSRAASGYSYYNDIRYQLDEWSTWKYDDENAGQAYDDQHDALRNNIWDARKHVGEDSPEMKKLRKQLHALEEKQPKQHKVVYYSLRATGHHSDDFELSEELGVLIDKIWTKVTKYHSQYRTGSMSLTGILKRLGQTGIGQDVKKAQDLAKRQLEANKRNQQRASIREAASKLAQLCSNAIRDGVEIPEYIPVSAPLFDLSQTENEPVPQE